MTVNQRIMIQGNLATLIEENVLFSVPLDDFLPKIERRFPINIPTLPTGTRAMLWDPTNQSQQKLLLLVERDPMIMHMEHNATLRDLSIPYTRFVFYCTTSGDPSDGSAWTFGDHRVFWARLPYTAPSTKDAIAAMLPNVYGDARICFGSTGVNANQTLANRIDQTVNEFFISRFNNDLTIRFPNGWTRYDRWVTMTRNDPSAWMTWPDLDPAQAVHRMYSFQDVMDEMTGGGTYDRFGEMMVPDGIPAVPLGASFGRLNEWLDSLDNSQRERLLDVTIARRNLDPAAFVAPVVVPNAED